MTEADNQSSTYLLEVNQTIQQIEQAFGLICTCHICDRLEFVSTVWEDTITMPMWFAKELAERLCV